MPVDAFFLKMIRFIYYDNTYSIGDDIKMKTTTTRQMRIYGNAHLVAVPPILWRAVGCPLKFEVSLENGNLVYKPLFGTK
jgi:hypothetical protein